MSSLGFFFRFCKFRKAHFIIVFVIIKHSFQQMVQQKIFVPYAFIYFFKYHYHMLDYYIHFTIAIKKINSKCRMP